MKGSCNFFLYFLLFNLDCLLLHQLDLSLTLEDALPKLSFPLAASRIDIVPSPVEHIIFPLTLIYGAVDELVDTFSMMFAVLPLPLIDRSIRVVVRTLASHLILLPLSLVELLSHDTSCNILNCEGALAVFEFVTFEKPPIAFVECSSRIVEPAIAC